ncbi:hypothetical protein ACVWVY_000293 [Bradyrhizobium sp. URHC0002]
MHRRNWTRARMRQTSNPQCPEPQQRFGLRTWGSNPTFSAASFLDWSSFRPNGGAIRGWERKLPPRLRARKGAKGLQVRGGATKMSHVAIPQLAAVSLVPPYQSVMEGVLTHTRDKPRQRSASDIPRKDPRGEILQLPGKRFGPRRNFPASAPINSMTPCCAACQGRWGDQHCSPPCDLLHSGGILMCYKKRDQWGRRPWQARHGTEIPFIRCRMASREARRVKRLPVRS